MSDFQDDFDGLDGTLNGLEDTIGGLETAAAAFRKELSGVQGTFEQTGREASGMSRNVSNSVRNAFEGVIFDGERLSDALSGLGRSIAGSALNQAVAPVQNAIGSSLSSGIQSILGGILPFAKGGVFSSGRVGAFARGGVVDGPTHFPMRGGVGLMGEAGPEAIMPLARGADGKLGVKTDGRGGAGAVNVTMNISTPDVEGFRRSQSQVAAEMNRAIQRGRRNL